MTKAKAKNNKAKALINKAKAVVNCPGQAKVKVKAKETSLTSLLPTSFTTQRVKKCDEWLCLFPLHRPGRL